MSVCVEDMLRLPVIRVVVSTVKAGRKERAGTFERRRDCDELLPLCTPSASPGVLGAVRVSVGYPLQAGRGRLCAS